MTGITLGEIRRERYEIMKEQNEPDKSNDKFIKFFTYTRY